MGFNYGGKVTPFSLKQICHTCNAVYAHPYEYIKIPVACFSPKSLPSSIKILEFVRYEKGEGLEKRQDDFAAEVASMVK